ncbi:MAG: 1-acyl-sn-glycerol-3-phosphate acyltransferase [Gemmatimonadota bacterium]|jgi:1-acyl-sn-glycerol-3-phosphate acyltransferase|nr:1-acyl-sn-glycerol-3-phosphate acyltransferase [Gemmatimonadota bacterium]
MPSTPPHEHDSSDRPVRHPPRGVLAHVRVIARLTAMAGWTGICYVLLLPGIVLTLPSRRWRTRLNGFIQRTWARGVLRCLSVVRASSGRPPAKPFFIAANHLSYLDILVLGADLGAVFVSKHELGRWPVMGHIARVTGTIFVDRGRRRDALRVLDEIDQAVANGGGVVLFPEGTSSRGDRIYPLKTALLEWAARRRHPVHPVTVRYASGDPARPASDAVCWWGDDTPFFDHFLGLASLPRIEAAVVYSDQVIVADERTRLAEELHAALTRAFVPVVATPQGLMG